MAAYNRQDWDRCRALLADDLVVADHRPAPALYDGIVGAEEFVTALRPLFDLASGVNVRVPAIHVVGRDRAVFQLSTTAASAEGADIELAFLLALVVDAGKITRLEFFAVDQLDAARARLDELSEPASSPPTIDALSNTAFRHWEEFIAQFAARDWDALFAGTAEGAVADDRRAIVGGLRYEGKEAILGLWRGIAAMGATDVTCGPLAIRGDRLVLLREVLSGVQAEAEVLFVIQFDNDGLVLSGVAFDPDDRATAFAQLDAYYAAELPPECVQPWKVSTALANRYNDRDLNGIREIFAADAMVVDERITGWGTLDPVAFVDHLRELVSMAPDAFLASVDVYEVAPHGSVGRLAVSGTVAGGGEFEIAFECVIVVRGEELARLELLPPGHVDEAVRRFRAFNPSQQPS
jgi:ketosteroid isomerase-like protein